MRFLKIASQLPLDLQELLCLRLAKFSKTLLSPEVREAGFRLAAEILLADYL